MIHTEGMRMLRACMLFCMTMNMHMNHSPGASSCVYLPAMRLRCSSCRKTFRTKNSPKRKRTKAGMESSVMTRKPIRVQNSVAA